MPEIKRVLLLYTDPYYLVKQVYPFGLDLLAAGLKQEGVEVRIEHALLPGADPKANIESALADFQPDLVSVNIRNIDTCMACEDYGDVSGQGYRSFYFLPGIRNAINAVRELLPGMPVILGGGGFTVAPEAMLRYMNVEFGVVGEGEEALIEFTRAWPDRDAIAGIPGQVMLDGDQAVINPRRPFVFPKTGEQSRDPGFRHAFATAGLPVRVKRGFNQACSFCVESLIEGRSFVFRDITQVVAELEALADVEQANKAFFVDTEFNVPDLEYPTGLIRALIQAGLNTRFGFASQFLPRPFTRDFAELLAEAGFSVILTCTSFADQVLEQNGISYREAHILNALDLCAEYEIDVTVDLIFGLPGETGETIEHTIARMNELPPAPLRHYEYTVGARVYPGTALARLVGKEERNIYGAVGPDLLEPCFYCSPSPPLKLKAYVDARVKSPMRFDNELSETSRARLAVGYLADRGRFEEAYDSYLSLGLADKSASFDYFFRCLAETGHAEAARLAALNLKRAALDSGDQAYADTIGVIDFYLGLLDRAGI